MPLSAIDLYLQLCPNCNTSRKQTITSKRNPLKMILTSKFGFWTQVDLIDMTSQQDPLTGDKWIMRYADHLSALWYVRCL